jgi:hypothetical protein
MLLFGPLASQETIQRFRTEASAVASLQHPHIVAIHEVGFTEGQHFFAMDFVAGPSLAKVVARGPLPAAQAARYVRTIAEAIHFAHEHGILHRDLKPSNILVDEFDQPRVTDFGLAKRLETDGDLTLSGQVLGSPNYMPPEQAAAKRGAVGRCSDVYSLGAILYHLLTGRPPFVGQTISETLHQVLTVEPIAPRLFSPAVPRDLETITLKCLEKEPAKRYATAGDLTDELNRFSRDEPIRARPVSTPEKLWRWCRRKPALAGALAAAVFALVLGLSGVLWQSAGRRKALAETKHALIESRRTLYAAQMNLVKQAWDEGAIEHAQAMLKAQIPKPGEEDLRGFEWRHFWQLCRDESSITIRNDPPQPVQSVAVSPDGKMIVFDAVTMLRNWSLETRSFLPRFKETSGKVRSLVFSPDGSRIACGLEGTLYFGMFTATNYWTR